MEAKLGKEIVLTVKNKIGLLFDFAKLLAEKGLGILAINGVVAGGHCVIRLITDDNLRATDALIEKGFAPREEEVILVEVPHKPGMLKRVAEVSTAESVDIQHIYASALQEQEKCLLVLHTDNDEHLLPKLHQLSAT